MSTEQTRHLVLDSRIIDETVDAKLTVGEVSKHPQNPLSPRINRGNPVSTTCTPTSFMMKTMKSTSVGTIRSSLTSG